MCIQNDFMEKEALRIMEEIKESTLYTFVRCDFSDINPKDTDTPLIKSIIVEDNKGELYRIKPNQNGLRFAKGEITYQEYMTSDKLELTKAITLLLGSIGFVGLVMFMFKIIFTPGLM